MMDYNTLLKGSDEQIQAILGEKHIEPIINDSNLKKGALILTDQRIYLLGEYHDKVPKKDKFIAVKKSDSMSLGDVQNMTSTYRQNGKFANRLLPFGVFLMAISIWSMSDYGIASGGLWYFFLGIILVILSLFVFKPRKYLLIRVTTGDTALEKKHYTKKELKSLQKALS